MPSIKEILMGKKPEEVLSWKGHLKNAERGLLNVHNIEVNYANSFESELGEVARPPASHHRKSRI
jgi:hypothetical protein